MALDKEFYKDEAAIAQSTANADPRIAAAIIQARALDRLTAAIHELKQPTTHGATGPNK